MANTQDIEAIVRQVLSSMNGSASAAAPTPSYNTGASFGAPFSSPAGDIPQTAHVAMLTALGHYDIKEFPIDRKSVV